MDLKLNYQSRKKKKDQFCISNSCNVQAQILIKKATGTVHSLEYINKPEIPFKYFLSQINESF